MHILLKPGLSRGWKWHFAILIVHECMMFSKMQISVLKGLYMIMKNTTCVNRKCVAFSIGFSAFWRCLNVFVWIGVLKSRSHFLSLKGWLWPLMYYCNMLDFVICLTFILFANTSFVMHLMIQLIRKIVFPPEESDILVWSIFAV